MAQLGKEGVWVKTILGDKLLEQFSHTLTILDVMSRYNRDFIHKLNKYQTVCVCGVTAKTIKIKPD